MPTATIIESDQTLSEQYNEAVSALGFQTERFSTFEEAQCFERLQASDVVLIGSKAGAREPLNLEEMALSDHTQVVVVSERPTLSARSDHRGNIKRIAPATDGWEPWKQSFEKALGETTADAETSAALENLLGESKAMERIRKKITHVAPQSISVFIQGESGTGKELIANAIHQLSRRRGNPFLTLNCACLHADLIGSELFGHEKGSFTGANQTHKGFFERADGGTLFLDEVLEMPLALQSNLLRVLETGKFNRIGGNKELRTDVRVIAATNQDPIEAVEQKRFRADLYYRLVVYPIFSPPLREHLNDIPAIARHMLATLNRQHDNQKSITDKALDKLMEFHWPGNVRELRNVITRAYVDSGKTIDDTDLELLPVARRELEPGHVDILVGSSVSDAEKRLILATLEHLDGDKTKAAKLLGISLKTLYNRLHDYESEPDGN